jgi:prephenate dehydratase
MGEALAALYRRCDQVRFLGSYPRAAGTNGAGTNGAGTNGAGTTVLGTNGVGAPAVPEHGTDAESFAAAHRWLEALRSGSPA